MIYFPDHQERFEQFLQKDRTHPKDIERRALFYVLSGCPELRERVNNLYDFHERIIRLERFSEVDLTSGTRSLLELAYNLYNNYPCSTVTNIFASLDERNRRLAVEAIKLRFGI